MKRRTFPLIAVILTLLLAGCAPQPTATQVVAEPTPRSN